MRISGLPPPAGGNPSPGPLRSPPSPAMGEGSKRRIHATSGIALAFALLLPACAPALPEDLAVEAAQGVEPDEGTLDEIADRIVSADAPQERALRVCLFSAVAAEVWVYRILFHAGDPDEAMTAMGSLLRMQAAVARVRAEAASDSPSAGLWFETEMFYTLAAIVRAVEGPVRDRVRGLVGSALTQDWRRVARGLRASAGQGVLAGAMLRDIRAAIRRLERGELSETGVWAACEARIAQKLQALSAALGISPAPEPPPEQGTSRALGPPGPA